MSARIRTCEGTVAAALARASASALAVASASAFIFTSTLAFHLASVSAFFLAYASAFRLADPEIRTVILMSVFPEGASFFIASAADGETSRSPLNVWVVKLREPATGLTTGGVFPGGLGAVSGESLLPRKKPPPEVNSMSLTAFPGMRSA